MSIMNNSQAYNINLENEVSVLLSHFETDFVLNVLRNNVETRIKYNSLVRPNLVSSFEQSFKEMRENYPASSDEIAFVRNQTYVEIIEELCKIHNLRFNAPDMIDPFTGAFYLYKFLVCDFQANIENFFIQILLREKEQILLQLGLIEEVKSKKIRDRAVVYNGTVVYKDPYMTMLATHLVNIIPLLSNMDITLRDIIMSIPIEGVIKEFLSNTVADSGDFYKSYYIGSLANPDFGPYILGSINLQLQEIGTTIERKEEN